MLSVAAVVLGAAAAAAIVVSLPMANGLVGAHAAGADCAAPPSVLEYGAPLSHVGKRLAKGLPVRIVAIGSSSTWGVGASDWQHSYPSQLAAKLQRHFPHNPITVENKGISGEETGQMLARFDRDVLTERPDLVVWQIGSNEILRGHDPSLFRRQAEEGVKRLTQAGIDVVLMDVQYSPRLLKNPQAALFNDILRDIAAKSKLALLDRFEAMHYWVASGQMELAELVTKDDLHMTDTGYRCTGELLAKLIEDDLPKLAAQ